jgi:hypothetical protein
VAGGGQGELARARPYLQDGLIGLEIQKAQDLFNLALDISKLLHITIIDLGQGVEVCAGVVGLVVLPGGGGHFSTSPFLFLPGLLRMASGQSILEFPNSTDLNH